ncbi:MAG TPA: DUF4339 domain-containing protein [Verrucomicrobiae bacterium]|nr:DUF4339 domain-containing protein [Verrucomicrobiae bacterium]
MLWYYESDGKQQGPVSDEALAALLRDGTIADSTLVWREGMPAWQPLATARLAGPPPPPPAIGGLNPNTCVECGKIFPPDELITLNHSKVCGGCKPIYLQRLAEGATLPSASGLWRQGKKIVTVSETIFPDRCVKCNAPANGFRLKRVLYWQHPAYFLLILCNLLVLLIVMLIVRKKAVLHIGLCERHQQQRKTAIAASVTGILGSIVLFCVAGVMSSGWPALAGVVVLLIGVIWGIAKGRTIAATKIEKQTVWVRGAGPEFLDELPERPL